MTTPDTSLPTRADLDAASTWDAASAFATPEAWDAELAALDAELGRLDAFRGRLGESGRTLTAWFDESAEFFRRVGKLRVYATMASSVDATDEAATARASRLNAFAARAAAATAFVEPELLALGADRVASLEREEPRLAAYRPYFAMLEYRRPHVRSAEVEALLGAVTDPFRTAAQTHGTLVNAELKFAPAVDSSGARHEVGHASLYETSADRELRRTAFESYADAHLAFKRTFANALSAGVKQDVFLARARGYASSLDAALGSSFVPREVFDHLIRVFRANLPTWHRYWALRARALGVPRIDAYDVKAPLARSQPAVPFRDAVEWIAAGMRPLGDEYVNVMRRGALEERWVDWAVNRGKRFGAFSTRDFGNHPFIMMSYRDNLFSLSTLAHELGHSMHSHFTARAQPFALQGYGLFVAEVASNFNQALVRAHLLDSNDDADFQIAVLEEAMSNFHRYFFIMPTLARFELEVHERVERGQALTADALNALMADLFTEAFGDGVNVDRDRVGITWAEFSTHLYSNFYVYQYATGISAAHALAEQVRQDPAAAERYLAFLRAGASRFPLDALRDAGADLGTGEPVERTFAVLASYVDRLEQLLERRG